MSRAVRNLIAIFIVGTLFFYAAGTISAVIVSGATYESFYPDLIAHLKVGPLDCLHFHPMVFIYATGFFVLSVLAIVTRKEMPHAEMKGKEHGSNNFISEKEYASFIENNTTKIETHIAADSGSGRESNLLLSQNVKISYDTWLTHMGSLNTLVIGGTGEGKSRGFVKPNIYSLPVHPRDGKPISFVFTDPKGELCRDTAGFLQENGYDIKIFNLNEQKYSDCYNPFRYIRSPESLLIMVDSIVDNANGGIAPKDPHWTNSAKSLLNSICYFVYYEMGFSEQNFTSVSRLLDQCGSSQNNDNYKSDYDLLLERLQKTSPMKDNHPAIVWRRKVAAKGAEMSSIISTAQTSIRLFASKDIQRLTEVDTLAMDEIGDRPTALYIIIPTTNSTYNFIISMMYTQLFESLYYRAQNEYDGSLPHHVVFFQDEFANVGKIPDFDKKIATFRSVNISTCMIVQSPNQITTLYDKASADILDNVHQIVFIGSGGLGENSASKWMSTALGVKTIQAEETSVAQSNVYSMFGEPAKVINHSYTATERPLMTADELYRMPSDRSVVLIKGYKPFYDYKIDPDTALNFRSDRYSERTKNGRKLLAKYLWSINDKDPNSPATRRTVDAYKQGLVNAMNIRQRQFMERKADLEEELKCSPDTPTYRPKVKLAQNIKVSNLKKSIPAKYNIP